MVVRTLRFFASNYTLIRRNLVACVYCSTVKLKGNCFVVVVAGPEAGVAVAITVMELVPAGVTRGAGGGGGGALPPPHPTRIAAEINPTRAIAARLVRLLLPPRSKTSPQANGVNPQSA